MHVNNKYSNLLVQYKTRKHRETHRRGSGGVRGRRWEHRTVCSSRSSWTVCDSRRDPRRAPRSAPLPTTECSILRTTALSLKYLRVRSIQRIDWALDLMLTHVTQGEVERRHCSDRFGSVRSSVFCLKELISELIFIFLLLYSIFKSLFNIVPSLQIFRIKAYLQSTIYYFLMKVKIK